jgi:8-oxo-dGTP diphosphatase
MDLRKKNIIATLVFPKKDGRVWLAKKTRKIGVGSWNGWGGAVEEGETIRQAAKREFEEESGCTVKLEDLEYVGKVTFHNEKADGRKFDVEVHMFLLYEWEGKPRSTLEMQNPTPWPENGLPFGEMMASDADWLPFVLRSEWIEAEVWYVLDQNHKSSPTIVRRVDKLSDVD